MKRIAVTGFLVIIGFLAPKAFCSTLGVFCVDYTSNRFESGAVLNTDVGGSDSLPLTMKFNSTWDFATVQFKLPNGADAFNAGVVWMGTGKINYPEMVQSDLFVKTSFGRIISIFREILWQRTI